MLNALYTERAPAERGVSSKQNQGQHVILFNRMNTECTFRLDGFIVY